MDTSCKDEYSGLGIQWIPNMTKCPRTGPFPTTIMAGRNALKRGAQAVSKFGKAVANLAKKFGPVLSALGTLLSKVLTLGAQGILFLAQNLWILVLALTYFIYNEYTRNRAQRRN